ncbi:phosphatidylglycerophosphatase A family protein [Paraglaciecola chathamensis]|jgi:phosphatidylglycerophosphatase A|uniref:Phosphatidylglycerophosphatase A n=2 Tax=Paraglaciecola chathamensis TaxID=368405 RepID=A0A8H9IA03_9ALTE|nr:MULTISPECIES: phosphatidylglycerophosphatase A [Paraglaciecola]MBJ2134848.1 phosphatidylglycerophosphatase A [Paraglaciecola chathamensis]MBU3016740.1 phosphatidylglycerophosphatase A [Paraglaciecola agarilytica]MDO6840443.1 phosphatidylglycerophosphatase A [Paraglaciecola chathamensis]GAC10670.1 phosphatidylglycerophosphatase A [Paraglaciecola chathamensis S18K6]GGZ64813.1 phosphatidylglycerophosphatase A [Paraglaciecola oceanifecundans]
MDRHIRKRVSLANPIHFLALGFGSGLAPKAPGTFGTIAAIPLVCLLAYSTTLTGYVLVTLLASLIGIWLCGKTAHDMMVHDDSSIVWDEIAGLLITMIAVPLNWQTLLLGFVLFRILDILKPWPISYLDARVHGGFGIMIDDILAGVFALILMHITLYLGWL